MAPERHDDPFPSVRNQTFRVGPEEGNSVFFGRDVLQGLVDGIDEYVTACQQRRSFRFTGPVVLGCSPWVSDDKLIDSLESLTGACVILSKRPTTQRESIAWQRMRDLNERTPGVPVRAFPELSWMAPLDADGKPVMIGPYDRQDDSLVLSTFRTIGLRKTGRSGPPIAHAKLAVLGYLWWHDEDALGYPDDVIGFRAERLWVSSANFTYGSRRSLEFGYWTEEPALLEGTRTFLGQLMGASEDLDAVADSPNPELVPVDFDNDAMAEAAAEMSWDDFDEDEN